MLLKELLEQISNNRLTRNLLFIDNNLQHQEPNLPDNSLSNLKAEDILQHIALAVSADSHIESVNFGNHWIHWNFEQCPEALIVELSEKLKNNLFLKKISVNVGPFLENNTAQLLQLLNCLKGNLNIQELILNFNFNDPLFISGLTSILNENNSLKKISISGKPVSTNTDNFYISDFLSCLKKKSLKVLNINFLPLGELGIQTLFSNNQQKLKTLSLRGCDLKKHSVAEIEKFLHEKNSIFHLNLAFNPFTLNEYRHLSDIVNLNKKKHIFKKRQNFINAAIVLCQGYCQPGTLLSLLAVELLIKILCNLGRKRTYFTPQRVLFCSLVLIDNFIVRRNLIESNLALKQKTEFSQWWSSTYSFNQSTIQLFKKSTLNTPELTWQRP